MFEYLKVTTLEAVFTARGAGRLPEYLGSIPKNPAKRGTAPFRNAVPLLKILIYLYGSPGTPIKQRRTYSSPSPLSIASDRVFNASSSSSPSQIDPFSSFRLAASRFLCSSASSAAA